MFLKVCSNMQGSSGRGVVVGGQALSGLMKVAILLLKKKLLALAQCGLEADLMLNPRFSGSCCGGHAKGC